MLSDCSTYQRLAEERKQRVGKVCAVQLNMRVVVRGSSGSLEPQVLHNDGEGGHDGDGLMTAVGWTRRQILDLIGQGRQIHAILRLLQVAPARETE
jgi:hypothetical protein